MAQTASDDSLELPTNNDIVPVPEALSTPVMSAQLKYVCTYNDDSGQLASLLAWQDTTGSHGDTWIIVCYL